MKIAIAEEAGAMGDLLRAGEGCERDEIVSLNDFEASLAALRDPDLRVLILDASSRRSSGWELCRQVRLRSPAESYVYVIAVIGPGTASGRLEALDAGVDAVIEPPVDSQEILASLDSARRIADHEEQLKRRLHQLEQYCLDLELKNASLAEIASSDALTGLKNRRFFHEALEAQFSLSRRKGLPMSLVMIDVDQFKAFNDRFGHPAGDDALRDVGVILRSCVRDHDIVARYGGEEFAIILPATEAYECFPLVDRLRLTVARHPWPLRSITISLGVATLSTIENEPAALIAQADRALYDSKARGRNQVTHARDLPDSLGAPLDPHLGNGRYAQNSIPVLVNHGKGI